MKPILLAFLSLSLIAGNQLAAQQTPTSNSPSIGLNSELSFKMMEPYENLRKAMILIEERKAKTIANRQLVIGVNLIALANYQTSNVDSKFGYLMRHPTASNQIGKVVSEAVLHSFQLSATYTVTPWMAAYAEMLYDPQQSFGAGIITTIERNQIQLRKGFILIGDLNKHSFYGAIGKMDAPFGLMGTVSPFTNSTTWHAFGGLAYGAQISFKQNGFHATFMAVQGGAQFRALSTPVGDSTNVPSLINNFTADINQTFTLGENRNLMIGASYMHGSAYCHEFPVFHFDPCKENNPAWTAYAKLEIDQLTLKGGYVRTLKVWPGTHNPTPPLDVFEASHVSALDIGAKYVFGKNENRKHAVSAEFSNFVAGPDGSPWERQNQIIAGYSLFINKSSKLFVELFRTDGFVPLNWISGSHPFAPFPPGTTHSEQGVFSNGIVIGGQIAL